MVQRGVAVAALLVMVLLPARTRAQDALPDLTGQRVRITLEGRPAPMRGTVASQDSAAITLRESGGNVRVVPIAELDEVERSLGRAGNAGKGFWIGAGGGFVLGGVTGAVIANDICGSCDPETAKAFVLVGVAGALVGGLLGGLIGAAAGSERWEPVGSAARLGRGPSDLPTRSAPAFTLAFRLDIG